MANDFSTAAELQALAAKLDALSAAATRHERRMPMSIDETETTEYRMLRKPVIESRLLDDMQSLDSWTTETDAIELSLSDEVKFEEKKTLRMVCPANLPDFLPNHVRGRIYTVPKAIRKFDDENWNDYNRLSIWIRPEIKGMKTITLRLQLHNGGANLVPDRWDRTGGHNVTLKPFEWNHVVMEMPLFARDHVESISIDYDMVGHENDADAICTWYLAKLELQKVKADREEGWTPDDHVFAFSGSGFRPEDPKKAFLAPTAAKMFKVLETATGRVVLETEVKTVEYDGERVSVLDFSAVRDAGDYILICGDKTSRTVHVTDDVWLPSIWKVLNFYYCQRCGVDIPGKHRACHRDLMCAHGEKPLKMVLNGGWHDAADLSQFLGNTADNTAALFLLADELKGKDPALYVRVLEEAEWGLDYVLRARFGDGWRSNFMSLSIWTDGVLGTADDIVDKGVDRPYNNLVSAFAEACGAYSLKDRDPVLADYALRIAREDFAFACKALAKYEAPAGYTASKIGLEGVLKQDATEDAAICEAAEIKTFAVGATAAAALVRAGATECLPQGADFARKLMECQEQGDPDWETSVTGFFYVDRAHTVPLHQDHHSFVQYVGVALDLLLRAAPEHQDAALWKAALKRLGEGLKTLAKVGGPYGMLPESVYFADEMEKYPELMPKLLTFVEPIDYPDYRRQVENGFPLDKAKGVYARRFPVWFAFRGNCNIQLSCALLAAAAWKWTGDEELRQIAQDQLRWTVGANPFGQSLIYGEGYNWTDEYTVQCGQTIGQMPVGIQTRDNLDKPWWPHAINCVYKEVWINPPAKWMWLMSYFAK